MRFEMWSRAAVVGVAALCVCSLDASPRALGSRTRTDLRVPGRTNATPSLAADGDRVAIVWGASLPSGDTDVFVSTSHDEGRTFSVPARVNDVDGDARVNGEQPPRVSLTHDAVIVVWTTKGARGTILRQAQSSDDGRTFGKSTVVSGTDAVGNRGWENIATARAAGSAAGEPSYVVWLDHRGLAAQDGEVAVSHHDHAAMASGTAAKPDGVAPAQKSRLYVAALDGQAPPVVVTAGVCYCCKTAISVASDGSIAAAWRHVYPGNIRDIAFSRSRDGGHTFSAPVRVSEDKWVLEGCPDDGPAMATDASGRIHIVWPTLVDDGGQETIALFYATSDDGKRFTPRERIGTQGIAHHPQITIAPDGTPVIAWDEAAGGGRRAAMAHVVSGEEGRVRFTREVLDDVAVYPVVAATRAATVVAWTSGKSPDAAIRVQETP